MLDPDWFARYQAHVLCSVLLGRRLLDARVHILYYIYSFDYIQDYILNRLWAQVPLNKCVIFVVYIL